MERLRRMAGPHWLALFALVLAAWAALWAMSAPEALRAAARLSPGDVWAALCSADAGAAGLAGLSIMWALMALAMMAPTFVPSLLTFDDLIHAGAARRVEFWALLGGYLAVWAGFSVAAAALQQVLAGAGLLTAFGESRSALLSSGLLIGAGAYQFTTLKARCLTACRLPLTHFMERWRGGVANATRMGAELGLACLGCCWALMLLGFVGGVMNLGWMALAMVLMLLEKLPDLGRRLTGPLGAALLVLGGWMLAGAIFGA